MMRWAVQKPRLFRGSGEIIVRLAQVADPLPPEALPAVAVFFPDRPSPDLLAAYRKLGGRAADERLVAWMSAPTERIEPVGEELATTPRISGSTRSSVLRPCPNW